MCSVPVFEHLVSLGTLVISLFFVRVEFVKGIVALLAHHLEEIFESNMTITSLRCLVDHVMEFLVSQIFTHILRNFLQIKERDRPNTVHIEQLKSLSTLVSAVLVAEQGGEHLAELVKVECLGWVCVDFFEHFDALFFSCFISECSNSGFQLADVNRPVMVRVEQHKSFFKLLHVLLVDDCLVFQ